MSSRIFKYSILSSEVSKTGKPVFSPVKLGAATEGCKYALFFMRSPDGCLGKFFWQRGGVSGHIMGPWDGSWAFRATNINEKVALQYYLCKWESSREAQSSRMRGAQTFAWE